jgi:hypothetical protein
MQAGRMVSTFFEYELQNNPLLVALRKGDAGMAEALDAILQKEVC